MKKLIWIMGVALLVMALITAGVTIAWFTDKKETNNVFTAGDVVIGLTELTPEGDVIDVTNHLIQMDYGHVYPGLSVRKNTTVTNLGSEDAFIASQIIIRDGGQDITKALSIPGKQPTGVTDVDDFFHGGVWADDLVHVPSPSAQPHLIVWESENYIVQYDTSVSEGILINVFVKDVLTSNDSLLMWGGFTFPLSWQNEQMLECTNLSIGVKTYAVQAAGFTDCVQAVTTAFGEDFGVTG